MLSPGQFEVNEAWVFFRLNKRRISAELDGSFDCVTFSDAASGILLCTELMCVDEPEAWATQAAHLLQLAYRRHKRFPKTILSARGVLTDLIRPEAMRQGIDVIPLSADQMLVFSSEPRQAFAEQFERGALRNHLVRTKKLSGGPR